MPLPVRPLTMIAVLGLVALTASACGRRGGLEPPPGSAAAVNRAQSRGDGLGVAGPRVLPQSLGLGGGAATPEPDAVRAGDELDAQAVSGSGTEAPVTTTKGARRGYTVPKQPFFLDPLL